MTQVYDAGPPLLDQVQLHGAPWPLVERRGRPRPLPGARSQPDGSAAALAEIPLQRRAPARPGAPSSWRHRYRLSVLGLDVAAGLAGAGWAVLQDWPFLLHPALPLLTLPLVWLLLLGIVRAYELGLLEAGRPNLRCVLDAGSIAAVTLVAAAALAGAPAVPLGLLAALVLAMTISLTARAALGRVVAAARARGRCQSRVLLVGPPQTVQELSTLLCSHPEDGVVVVGCCLPKPNGETAVGGVPMLGDLDEVAPIVWRGGVDVVAVASAPETSGPALRRLAWTLEGSHTELVVAPGIVELDAPRLHVRRLTALPLLHLPDPEVRGPRRLIKRAAETVLASALLVLLVPLMVAIALLIRLTSPGPAFFRQSRVGRDGEPFVLVKFRTMSVDAEQRHAQLMAHNKHVDGALFKMERDPRVTRIGGVLRRLSLDELPQLFHVLTGRMSLVGPRPALPSEVGTHDETVRRRLLVRPGITGLWQVSGRSDLSWDDSVLLDLRYVENWSLGLDIRILCRTVTAVLRGRGAY